MVRGVTGSDKNKGFCGQVHNLMKAQGKMGATFKQPSPLWKKADNVRCYLIFSHNFILS